MRMHAAMAAALDSIVDDILRIRDEARTRGFSERPRWPMLVLRTPKGWTGPKEVDGKPVEGTFRAHQVPLTECARRADQLQMLEQWLRNPTAPSSLE